MLVPLDYDQVDYIDFFKLFHASLPIIATMDSNFNKLVDAHAFVIGESSGIELGVAQGVVASGDRDTIASWSRQRVERGINEREERFLPAKVAGVT